MLQYFVLQCGKDYCNIDMMIFKFDPNKVGRWYEMAQANLNWQFDYASTQKTVADFFEHSGFMRGQEKLSAQMARLLPTDVMFLHMADELSNAVAHQVQKGLDDYIQGIANKDGGGVIQYKNNDPRQGYELNLSLMHSRPDVYQRHTDYLMEKVGKKSIKEFKRLTQISSEQEKALDGTIPNMDRQHFSLFKEIIRVNEFLNRPKNSVGVSPLRPNEVNEEGLLHLLSSGTMSGLGWKLNFDTPSEDKFLEEQEQTGNNEVFTTKITMSSFNFSVRELRGEKRGYRIDSNANGRLAKGAIQDGDFLKENLVLSVNYTDSVCEKLRDSYQNYLPYKDCLKTQIKFDKFPLQPATFETTQAVIHGKENNIQPIPIKVENIEKGVFIPSPKGKRLGSVGIYRSTRATDEPYLYVSSGQASPHQVIKMFYGDKGLLDKPMPSNRNIQDKLADIDGGATAFYQQLQKGKLNTNNQGLATFARFNPKGAYQPVFPLLTDSLEAGQFKINKTELEQEVAKERAIGNLRKIMMVHHVLSDDDVLTKENILTVKTGLKIQNGHVLDKPDMFEGVTTTFEDGTYSCRASNEQETQKIEKNLPPNTFVHNKEVTITRTAGAVSGVGYQIEQLVGANHTYFERKYEKNKGYTLHLGQDEKQGVIFRTLPLPNPLKVVGGQAIAHLVDKKLAIRPNKELVGSYQITQTDSSYDVKQQIGLVDKELFALTNDNFAKDDRLKEAFSANLTPAEFKQGMSKKYSHLEQHHQMQKSSSESLIVARVSFNCSGDTLPIGGDNEVDYYCYQSGQRYQNRVNSSTQKVEIDKLTLKDTNPMGSVTPVVENLVRNQPNVVLLGEGLDTMQTLAFTLGIDERSKNVAVYSCHDANNLKRIAQIMAENTSDPDNAIRSDNTVVRIMADSDWVYRGQNAKSEVGAYVKLMQENNVPLSLFDSFYENVSIATQKGEQAKYQWRDGAGNVHETVIEPMRGKGDNILKNTGFNAGEQAKATLQKAGFNVEVVHPPQPFLESLRTISQEMIDGKQISRYDSRPDDRLFRAEYTDYSDLFHAQAQKEYQKIFDDLGTLDAKRDFYAVVAGIGGLAPTTGSIDHEKAFAKVMFDRTRKSLVENTTYDRIVPVVNEQGRIGVGKQQVAYSLKRALKLPENLTLDIKNKDGNTRQVSVNTFLSAENQKRFDESLSLSLGELSKDKNIQYSQSYRDYLPEKLKQNEQITQTLPKVLPELTTVSNVIYPKAMIDKDTQAFISQGANLNAHLKSYENENGEYLNFMLPDRQVLDEMYDPKNPLSEGEILNIWTQLVKPTTYNEIKGKAIPLLSGFVDEGGSKYQRQLNSNNRLNQKIHLGKINVDDVELTGLGDRGEPLLREYITALYRENPSNPIYHLPLYEKADMSQVRSSDVIKDEMMDNFVLNNKRIDNLVKSKLWQDHAHHLVQTAQGGEIGVSMITGFGKKESVYITQLAQKFQKGEQPELKIYKELNPNPTPATPTHQPKQETRPRFDLL